MIDASRLVHNGSKVSELFRLNGWFRTYKDSARVRAPAGQFELRMLPEILDQYWLKISRHLQVIIVTIML